MNLNPRHQAITEVTESKTGRSKDSAFTETEKTISGVSEEEDERPEIELIDNYLKRMMRMRWFHN